MVFGSLAKGYKAGGYNSVEVGSRFDNEDVWNLEGGVKSLFADLGLILNASAFYYEYMDKQAISLVTGVNGSGVPQYVVDSSDEEAFGLEAEARWQPVPALTLSANLAWIDATYKKKLVDDGDGWHARPGGRADRRAVFLGCARRELRLAAGHVRHGRRFGHACLSRRVALQCRFAVPGHLPGQPELQRRRGDQPHRPAAGVGQAPASAGAWRRS